MRVTDRTKLSEATGRALFNPVQFVSALFNGRVADGFLNRFALFSVVVGGLQRLICVPDTDMASMAARYGGVIGSKSIAKLDSARNRYFKIDNGPHVGDRCYDIQYSPIWEDVGG